MQEDSRVGSAITRGIVRDERGRRWSGIVMGGNLELGPDDARLVFVCRDAPDERTREVRMAMAPEAADAAWSRMSGTRRLELFRRARAGD